jgi:hypothetical protein
MAIGRLEVGTSLVNGDGRPVKIDIDGLIDLEVDGLVETRTVFDYLVKGLKNGT